MRPRISYAGKTLFFESIGTKITRREFLKDVICISAGVAFFSIVLNNIEAPKGEATIYCCYGNCFSECHSDCGRKSW